MFFLYILLSVSFFNFTLLHTLKKHWVLSLIQFHSNDTIRYFWCFHSHIRVMFSSCRFQNKTLLINNTWPQFTECFMHTVLIWVPCAFVWLTLPLYISSINKQSKRTPNHVSLLNGARLVSFNLKQHKLWIRCIHCRQRFG